MRIKFGHLKISLTVMGALLLVACGVTELHEPRNVSRRADANGFYRVRPGDTLTLIARAKGVSVQNLMAWNDLVDPDRVDVGWRLRLRPDAGSPRVTATKPKSPNSNANQSNRNTDLGSNPQFTNSVSWGWPANLPVVVPFNGASSKGVVLSGPRGAPVLAASAGEVIYAGNSLRGYGNMLVLKHNENWSSVYANNERLLVKVGDFVKAGQTIATVGNSDANRPQLYFEVRLNAKPIDPLKVLPRRNAP